MKKDTKRKYFSAKEEKVQSLDRRSELRESQTGGLMSNRPVQSVVGHCGRRVANLNLA